ncbi:ORF6N domain-containing protein [Flavobacterium sp.]|uniref:ORF6N domain-containing protein n=1 Tax=Flavobacterium sp. TaxID=239 RepID=UPI002B4B3A8D|nr:ORF6N domain-containing protein [Flavobacterium sp.]HLP65380.1 ORF6N domain-containing protein [Flavobacterium sp.]
MKNIELITNKIHFIRNQKVMLDYDLALLYEIETRVLKQAVKRNINRFPDDFMFELSETEIESLVSQFVIPSKSKFGGSKPFAFTEQGIAMLSSILNSEKAIKINIAIMRIFVLLRNSILSLEEISKKVEDIENQLPDIYKILNFLMDKNQQNTTTKDRPKIGYK